MTLGQSIGLVIMLFTLLPTLIYTCVRMGTFGYFSGKQSALEKHLQRKGSCNEEQTQQKEEET